MSGVMSLGDGFGCWAGMMAGLMVAWRNTRAFHVTCVAYFCCCACFFVLMLGFEGSVAKLCPVAIVFKLTQGIASFRQPMEPLKGLWLWQGFWKSI